MYRTYQVSSDINKHVPLWFNLEGYGQWVKPEEESPGQYEQIYLHERFSRQQALEPSVLPFSGDLRHVSPSGADRNLAEKIYKDMLGAGARPQLDINSYWYTYLKPAGVPWSNYMNSMKGTNSDRNRQYYTVVSLYQLMSIMEESIYAEMVAWPTDAKYPPEKRGDIKNNGYYIEDSCITIEFSEPEINTYKVRQHRDTLYAKTVKGQNKVFNTFFPGVPEWFTDKKDWLYFEFSVEIRMNGKWWTYSSSEGAHYFNCYVYYLANNTLNLNLRDLSQSQTTSTVVTNERWHGNWTYDTIPDNRKVF